jgi:hypothetical protein
MAVVPTEALTEALQPKTPPPMPSQSPNIPNIPNVPPLLLKTPSASPSDLEPLIFVRNDLPASPVNDGGCDGGGGGGGGDDGEEEESLFEDDEDGNIA